MRAAKSAELLPKSVREQRTVNLAQAVRRLSDCGHRELAPDSATGRVALAKHLNGFKVGGLPIAKDAARGVCPNSTRMVRQ